MAQHDQVIDNGSGLAVRTDINAALAALFSTSSGPIEPSTMIAGQFWFDTADADNARLWQRNASNTAWNAIPRLNDAGDFSVGGSIVLDDPTSAIEFVPADIGFGARPSTTSPAAPNRFVWNDKPDLSGTDIMTLSDTGMLQLPLAVGPFGPQDLVPYGKTVNGVRLSVRTSSGTYTKPADLKFLEVTCVGGGGGSYASSGAGAGASSASGGGAGGATVMKLYAAADIAASEIYTIGAGGTAEGGAGGGTIFKMLGGGGGFGGSPNTGAGSDFALSAGGNGGAASGGDLNLAGGNGGEGIRAAHGQAVVAQGGNGGGSFFAQPRICRLASTGGAAAGQTGVFPGGGASGVSVGASATTTGGAGGGGGCIIFKEYF